MTTIDPKAVQDCHELLVWLIPQLDKFPRARRFTLGDRIEQRLLDVLEDLVEATWSNQALPALTRANRRLEMMRHLWRAAFELKLMSMRQYEFGSRKMDGIGRQIGGWIKALRR